MEAYGYGSIAALARDLGHDRSETLSRINRDPEAKPSVDLLVDLSNKFDDLNLDWFLTGIGEVRLPRPRLQASAQYQPSAAPTPQAAERPGVPISLSHVPHVVTIEPNGKPNIVMIDAQAAAGLPSNIDRPEFFADKPAFRLPGAQYQSGSYICIQVSGDSMHPTIYHQDWLIARFLEEPLQQIREGYVHILVTREGVVSKRLLNRGEQRGTLVCQSDNEGYPTYEEPLTNVLQVYKVEGRLSFNLANINQDMRRDINGLRADLVALRSDMGKEIAALRKAKGS